MADILRNALNDLIAEYERLRARKEELKEMTDLNSEELKEIEGEIMDKMVEQDMPSVTIKTEGYGVFTYTPQVKTKYSLIGEDRAAAKGVNRFEVLRDNGFDYLIKETVNQNSFNSAISELIGHLKEGESMPEDLAEVVTSYDVSSIGRTKANSKALEKLADKMPGSKYKNLEGLYKANK